MPSKKSFGVSPGCFLTARSLEHAREVAALGAGEILLTSMDRDGSKAGFDIALTRAVADAVTIPVIASGEVGTLDHLVAGVLEGHASAVLAASIFHFGEFSMGRPRNAWRRRASRCGWIDGRNGRKGREPTFALRRRRANAGSGTFYSSQIYRILVIHP